MKTIYLVRHAKSDWGYDGLKDIDRPLNERGYQSVYFLPKEFLKKAKTPDLIVSSSAIRAMSTALIFARSLNYPENKIVINPNIYEAHELTLREIIENLSDEYSSVMLFGHNPGFTNAINTLSDSFIDNLPTCGLVSIEFKEKQWKEITTGKLKFSLFPKEIIP